MIRIATVALAALACSGAGPKGTEAPPEEIEAAAPPDAAPATPPPGAGPEEGPPANATALPPGQGWWCHRAMAEHLVHPCQRTLPECEESRRRTDPGEASVGPCEAREQAFCVTWRLTALGRDSLGRHCLPTVEECAKFKRQLFRGDRPKVKELSRCDPRP